MTFNILSVADIPALGKGYKRWSKRKDKVFETIEREDSDLIAIQESSPNQANQLKIEFSKDFYILVHKGFSTDSLLMIKKNRFEVIEHGYWGLEEPLLPYKVRRLAVWVSVRDKKTRKEIFFVGTHLDAKDRKEEEIKIIMQHIKPQQESGAPIFLCGDFNFSEKSHFYHIVASGSWKDSYYALDSLSYKDSFTFSYLNPHTRIDHVFYFIVLLL